MTPPLRFGEDGWPREQDGSVAVAGLSFVGLLFQRGFHSMLAGGVGRDAGRLARSNHHRRPTPHRVVLARSLTSADPTSS